MAVVLEFRYRQSVLLQTAISVAFLCCGAPRAWGQLATPASDSGPALTQPTASILLTPSDITGLQTWWNTPTAGYETTVRDNVDATANSTLSTAVPASLADAQSQSTILQAEALRWLLTGNGNTSSSDFLNVESVLANSANLTGGSSITGPLVGMNYFTAFDFINSGLSSAQRATITSRLTTDVLPGLGTTTRVNNQYFINYGARGFYAMLAGNETDLNAAMAGINAGYNATTTNDGFFTDGDRYLNYTLGSMPAYLNAYKNWSGDTAGIRQYEAAANQQASYALGIRLPNGTTPSFHNSDNAPIAIQELSRMVTDPALKSATVWNAQQLNGFNWGTWTNALNQDGTYTDLLWTVDQSAGAAAPTWSPTYFSGGQAKISVFRNNWSTTSNYLATTAGIDGNSNPTSFGHSDTGAITLAANGAQILVEPGYARYNGVNGVGADSPMPNTPAHSTPGPNLDTSAAIEHNVLLARDTGTTTWGIGDNGANEVQTTSDISITNRLDSGERGNFKGVADFSTLKADYTGGGAGSNVQMRRSTGMINESSTDPGYFVMADSFRATDSVNKDFAVNLIGKSTPANTQIMVDTATYKELRWSVDNYFGITSNNAQETGPPYDVPVSGQVIAHIVSSGSMNSVAADSTWMVDNFGIFIQTQRMQVSVSNTDHGAFLTFFETGPANFTSRWAVTPLSGANYAAARIDSLDGWTDWHISQTSASDVHSTSAGALVSIDNGALTSDAQYAYLRRVGPNLDSAMISQGTTLSSHGSQILGSSNPITASFLFSNVVNGEISGTLSMDDYLDNTTLTFFHLPGLIMGLTYDNLPLNSFTGTTVTFPLVDGLESVPFDILFAVPATHPFQNPLSPLDVDNDGSVFPLDALVVINELNLFGSHTLLAAPYGTSSPPPYLDVNGDGMVSPLDVLLIINELNSQAAANSRAEAFGPRLEIVAVPEPSSAAYAAAAACSIVGVSLLRHRRPLVAIGEPAAASDR